MLDEIQYRWSGQVIEPVDGLGYVGPEPEGKRNRYIITGDSGMGITHATLGAMLVRDMILGRDNPWEKIYDPGRISLLAVGEMVKEDVNMAVQYADWLKPGDAASVKEIANGDGAVISKGLKKYAVYKEENGKTHVLNATCTHLGCVVQWNSGEKTWDCPCHGSRFDAFGIVINGPAKKNLEKEKEEDLS